MALSRLYEENEVAPELRRLYADLRASLDLPFVPSIFKLLAAFPDYLLPVWEDLGPVARSREFQSAGKALEEYSRSLVVSAGWQFSDQRRVLAAQKFSPNDVAQLCGIAATFTRSAVSMALLLRLLQKGYSGGQAGRISNGRQASALARILTLHIPAESQAGLRVWLIYSDIRRTMGVKTVHSMFRLLAPFPAYLATVWLDSKKLIADSEFMRAQDEVAKRALGLLTGIPVRDQHALAKSIRPQHWREIEETVDVFARLSPQIQLLAAVWERSFPSVRHVAA